MKVDIYSICWNEADMLGFFFEHYDDIANRYIIYDDGSTDGTLEILNAHPKVEVRRFLRNIEDSYVLSAQHIHNTVWKESRNNADWVIITAIDEHLVHTDLHSYLQKCLKAGVTIVPALGYQMISDSFPDSDAVLREEVTTGALFPKMSKLCVFQPDAVSETNFSVGRHCAEPAGDIITPFTDEVLNLHFKYLDFDRVFARHRVLASGLGKKDVEKGWGHRYWFDKEKLQDDWDGFKAAAIDINEHISRANELHTDKRWWRHASLSYAQAKVSD